MTLNLDRIEQAAKAAQDEAPGRWYRGNAPDECRDSVYADADGRPTFEVADLLPAPIAEHIAACSPDVVLALVAIVKLSVEYERADACETSDVCDAAYLKWRAAVRALQGRKP